MALPLKGTDGGNHGKIIIPASKKNKKAKHLLNTGRQQSKRLSKHVAPETPGGNIGGKYNKDDYLKMTSSSEDQNSNDLSGSGLGGGHMFRTMQIQNTARSMMSKVSDVEKPRVDRVTMDLGYMKR